MVYNSVAMVTWCPGFMHPQLCEYYEGGPAQLSRPLFLMKEPDTYNIFLAYNKMSGMGQHSQYSDSLQAGQSRDWILVEARFSTPVQTSLRDYPASCTMGTGSFTGYSSRGVALPTHPQLVPRLEGILWAFMACYRVNFNSFLRKWKICECGEYQSWFKFHISNLQHSGYYKYAIL
jgi:hypothetical protein